MVPPNLQRPTTTTIATMAARDDSVAATGIRQVTQYDIAEVALAAEGEGEGRTAADEGGAGRWTRLLTRMSCFDEFSHNLFAFRCEETLSTTA